MQLHVIEPNGTAHTISLGARDAVVMEAIRSSGLPIAAQCGGACACATCHVYVDEEWLDRLPPRDEAEEAMLELADKVQPNSRLSCQLALTPELDGLKVTLATDSVV